jgi:ERCC4-type nuclease
LNETAETILAIASKLERDFKKGKTLAFGGGTNVTIAETITNEMVSQTNTEVPKRYCEVVKKVKKENITPENIGEIILSQIPGISSTTAIAIMRHFTSFADLVEKARANPDLLKNLCFEEVEGGGKPRKISATVLKNIGIYLLGFPPNS